MVPQYLSEFPLGSKVLGSKVHIEHKGKHSCTMLLHRIIMMRKGV